MLGHQERSKTKVRVMAFLLVAFEVGIMIAYGLGTEMDISESTFPRTKDNSNEMLFFNMPATLAILGWGLIIAYSENSAIAGLFSTLLATGFTVQVQPLLIIFWRYVFSDFNGIYNVSNVEFAMSMTCLVSLMICLCGLVGRLGVVETFTVTAVFNICWPLNYYLLQYMKTEYWTGQIGEVFDSNGGAFIYLFAGVFSIITSVMINCKEGYMAGLSGSRQSAFIGLMGTGFAFASSPYTDDPSLFLTSSAYTLPYLYERALNIYFALTASVITTYISSFMFGSLRVGVRESLVGVLGGVAIISACAGFINNIGACIAIGSFGGFVSGFWLRVIHPRFNSRSTADHLGIMGPVTLNAFIGVIAVAPILFTSYKARGLDVAELSFVVVDNRAALYFLAITGLTTGIAIGGGLLAGLLCLISRDDGDDFHYAKLISTDFGLYGGHGGQQRTLPEASPSGIHNQQSASELKGQ